MRLDLGLERAARAASWAARSTYISLLDSVACRPWTVPPKPTLDIQFVPRYFHTSRDTGKKPHKKDPPT